MELSEEGKNLIRDLQRIRGNTIVLTYITSTRDGWNMVISMDTVRKFYKHLKSISTPKEETKIDLFLHSNGGDIVAPWKLVTLIREYCSEFNVIVPYRAFSAATLIALGADNIYMHPAGMLGPTDPTVRNDFNPPDPFNPRNKLGVSVEDVMSYIALAENDFGVQNKEKILELIAGENKIHPLALGHVKRFYYQARMIAKNLLKLHSTIFDLPKINRIVESLNSKSYFHGHPINREEAKKLGLPIREMSADLEGAAWKLYEYYEKQMDLEKPFDAPTALNAAHPQGLPIMLMPAGFNPASLGVVQKGVMIESLTGGSDVFEASMRIDGYRNYGQNGLQDFITWRQTDVGWK